MSESKDQTQSYLDLASQTYGIMTEAAAKTNYRTLETLKSVYEIVSRPYTSTAFEAVYRENLDRAGQLVELGVAAAQKSGTEAAGIAELIANQASQWQETFVETTRGMFRTTLSNLAYVKDSADQTFAGFSKRVEEMQKHPASVN
ncbi:MAG: hypothetical protein JOY59_11605 [Candidatus Eremiobacteraeota bacterium]|nr:hypothetical protein [Candidatus Eremiobacteraeota bacterium]